MSEPKNQPEFDDSLLSAYVDGELTAEERALVEARLAENPQARQLVAELKEVSAKVRSLPRAKVDGDLRADVLDQLDRPTSTLPPSDLSMPRRLLWPLLATAALVMLMIYQTEVKEDQLEVAQVQNPKIEDHLAKGKREASQRSVPAVGTIEAMREADKPGSIGLLAETSPQDEAASEKFDASSSGESLDIKSDLALDAAAQSEPASPGRVAGSLASVDSNVGLVHLTCPDVKSGAEYFDRLLISNGVQLVEESTDGLAARKEGKATFQDSSLFAESQSGGYGGNAAESDRQSTDAEMVLVEAHPEQIAQILLACNQDNESIESVTIDEPTAPTGGEQPTQQLDRFRQYEKPARSKASGQIYVVTPAQQGVIAALNSLDSTPEQSPTGTASEGPQQQAWATRLRADQAPTELKQLENEVQTRRNQAYNFAMRDQIADQNRKLAKKDADLPQQVRMLFLLHPSEAKK
ncbi:anti-sigma factor family protein [Bythopirellula polymerisocia]|uniref:Putative zinc-finger domain-containing protein n=1 Tax=Bythopirellula polymerisocia TaxID=2528003 RepID=A0A5C6D2X7_9BACT|nr:zf-HC2 domain-containing protein [Bythopirellula polymerisocia]TWU30131.1 hypothetical protein Pla144_09170 [Bythopirellula polymerisocia]